MSGVKIAASPNTNVIYDMRVFFAWKHPVALKGGGGGGGFGGF